MRRVIRALASIFVLFVAAPAAAQFETPNRSFHNGTTFPLQGRHQTIACESCHLKGVYKGTPRTCYDCHWVRRQDDKFQTRLGTQCETCHSPTTWTAARWDHAGTTGVPLNASHKVIGCESCHRRADFRAAAVTCATCHQSEYQATKNPNHAAAGFPLQCEACHKPSDTVFTQARFDHNASFPLSGPHTTATCASCHKNNVYKGTPRDCVACHRTEYERAQSPNHLAAGFPTACETCHRPTSPTWTSPGSTGFNHNAFYQLVGKHGTLDCASCHRNSVFKGTPRDCVGCHRADLERTQNPNHIAAGFPTTCDSCHRPSDASWKNGSSTGPLNHNSFYPLVGRHTMADCVACHRNNVYKGTPRDCVGCHLPEFERTSNPPHVMAGFATTCDSCHRPTDSSWRSGAGFNHNAVFQLQGVHAAQACATCHKNNVFKGTPRDCVGCHRAKYDQTTSPPHAAAGFSTTCETCHKPTDITWRSGTGFNHNAVFQLQGVHASQACATCHKNNLFKGTPRDCVGCHRPRYDQTTSPPHAAAGFSTTCETCHRAIDTTWKGATFNHASVFALQGVHASQACTSCHKNNVYKGTPRTCVGCHRAKYDATRNPSHAAAGFPTSCESCHRATDTVWTQGRFTHRFPITGPHNVTCAQCHTTANTFTVFSCTTCHTRTKTDDQHKNRTGYRYDSTACYACHPNGKS